MANEATFLRSKFFISYKDTFRALRLVNHYKKEPHTDLETAFWVYSWYVTSNDHEWRSDTSKNIDGIELDGSKLYTDDLNFLRIIAPTVKAGSYIEYQWDDDHIPRRLYFDGSTMREQVAEIQWKDIT